PVSATLEKLKGGAGMRRTGVSQAMLLLSVLAPAMASGETLVLTADRMLEVRSGRVVADAVVVVEDEHIRAAGARGAVVIPPGARVVALGDRTLLPGLFDMHVHLSAGSSRPRRFTQYFFDGAVDAALRAADNARVTLAAGFTSVRSAGDNDFIDVALD